MDGPPVRFLLFEGNPRVYREAVLEAGGGIASEIYARSLLALAPPGSTVTTVFPADPDGAALPEGVDWDQIDAVAWTGSALNVYDDHKPEVARQIALADVVFGRGVPFFGSCWALQIAAVAAGGTVAPNPRGREVGLARKVLLTEAGRAHPLHAGRPWAFDAIAIHTDEVTRQPPDCTVLSGNAMSAVQSAIIRHRGGEFWGVQYHPEFDIREISRLCRRYADGLIAHGLFRDRDAVDRFVVEADALADDPAGRTDLAWRLGVDADVLDAGRRLTEMRNWLARQVLPRRDP
ncbi:type 1 glutamine amidotransferase [Roseospira navarrensis]|uniref:Type 1 glutamine amidotransferase n=1 Tax=Roseospira navarrensis TaxID=140058 RepID=A0A7X1ZEA7_9PROT|nr:type 1 glutamine amidotransferase [Roseospira navarrensis]